MTVKHTTLLECIVIEPTIFKDERGYFYESFNEEKFNQLTGQNIHFVQDNQSFSTYGVLRGLHFQHGVHAQAKLVRVLKGEVLDVAVDIRSGSPTFGEHFSIVLSAENKLQLFIPRGFAHGFVVLSAEAEFFYKCDNYYNKESEGSILYNDTELDIDWYIDASKMIVSEKDKESGSFSAFKRAIQ
ncbi:dTDP-4-dehydrorhamnose 3,5-epimerase [Pontibacter sp. JH31]|uniref:dTDP-4-dehydrorhamnose 3,5-epimerase n=1 Tax=Pontibacter aquaedesilientis TaxID=2766980 RepID=A0ABR7XH51_9BACT|nr:dTDP-4-dehydrorhamnose 3,5-epimerase [Pontibacter aquaedesilientis]MBD1396943.1 dTDP-4-dehydrorhamnose 3,5-epimerase [Pontibacter aquaedesilientis]